MTDDERPDDPIAARLARLRDATASLAPRPDFTARVVAAARPRRSSLVAVWWMVPAAAAVAAAAIGYALASRPGGDAAARDVDAALRFPDAEVMR